jgi:1-acyl-sn-glycerol-3-phosphate acyltransferase
VPVAIRGSRKLLPAKTFMPRRSRLEVDILESIPASHTAFASSAELAELARQRILSVLDEPDLLQENAA